MKNFILWLVAVSTLSLGGLFGIAVGVEEGLEFNLLGLVIGIDPKRLAIKLPGLGQLGMG